MRNTGICLMAHRLGAAWRWRAAAVRVPTGSPRPQPTPREAYQQFLQQHPKSANAVQAQARIQQLAEDHDWQAAAAADTRDAYEQFVAQHADSKWAQEARIRIENFAQSGATGGKAASANTAMRRQALRPRRQAATAPPGRGWTAGRRARRGQGAGEHHGREPRSRVPRVARAFRAIGRLHSKARAESEWKLLAAKYPSELKSLKPHSWPASPRPAGL